MIRTRHRTLAILVIAVMAAGCSKNPAPGDTAAATDSASGSSSSSSSARRSAGYDRNRISPQEIQDALARNVTTVYDLIQRSRSTWLRPSGSGMGGSAGQIVAFENTNRLGGVQTLRNIHLQNVESIRWLPPSEAAMQFGLDVQYGAIQVMSRLGR